MVNNGLIMGKTLPSPTNDIRIIYIYIYSRTVFKNVTVVVHVQYFELFKGMECAVLPIKLCTMKTFEKEDKLWDLF